MKKRSFYDIINLSLLWKWIFYNYMLPISSFQNSQTSPLIDVDLNLSHPNLKGIISNPNHKCYPAVDPLWIILHHTSTTRSNLRGAFVPCSTLDEAEYVLLRLIRTSNNIERNHIQIVTSVGVHPYHTATQGDHRNNRIRKRFRRILLDNRYVSCIGKLGLDYFTGFPDKAFQLPWCEFQIKVATEFQLPLFVRE